MVDYDGKCTKKTTPRRRVLVQTLLLSGQIRTFLEGIADGEV